MTTKLCHECLIFNLEQSFKKVFSCPVKNCVLDDCDDSLLVPFTHSLCEQLPPNLPKDSSHV